MRPSGIQVMRNPNERIQKLKLGLRFFKASLSTGGSNEDFRFSNFIYIGITFFTIRSMRLFILQDVGDLSESFPSRSSGGNATLKLKTYNFEVCAPRWKDYIPCLDTPSANAKSKPNSRGEEARERHCPRKGYMCCLIAAPLNYKLPIRWPKSRNEVRSYRLVTSISFLTNACNVLLH